jgi:hypothetical protein
MAAVDGTILGQGVPTVASSAEILDKNWLKCLPVLRKQLSNYLPKGKNQPMGGLKAGTTAALANQAGPVGARAARCGAVGHDSSASGAHGAE